MDEKTKTIEDLQRAMNVKISAINEAQKIEAERLERHDQTMFNAQAEVQKREIAITKREEQQKNLSQMLAAARAEKVAALEREEAAAKKLEECRRERDGYKAQLAAIDKAGLVLKKEAATA